MKRKIKFGGGGCFNYLAILISFLSEERGLNVRGDLIE